MKRLFTNVECLAASYAVVSGLRWAAKQAPKPKSAPTIPKARSTGPSPSARLSNSKSQDKGKPDKNTESRSAKFRKDKLISPGVATLEFGTVSNKITSTLASYPILDIPPPPSPSPSPSASPSLSASPSNSASLSPPPPPPSPSSLPALPPHTPAPTPSTVPTSPATVITTSLQFSSPPEPLFGEPTLELTPTVQNELQEASSPNAESKYSPKTKYFDITFNKDPRPLIALEDLLPDLEAAKLEKLAEMREKMGPLYVKPVDTKGMTEAKIKVLQLLEEGKNVFFTGCAGTGKSYLIKKLREALNPDTTAVTASTGVAALNINGVTLNWYTGIGKGESPVEDLYTKVLQNSMAEWRWKSLRLLVIDEISMIDADMLTKLDLIAKHIRKNSLPFGGIQLLISGDFFQLPPAENRSRFCFDCETWKSLEFHTIEEKVVFRQSDQTFREVLNEARYGQMSQNSIDILNSRVLEPPPGIISTKLFAVNRQADKENSLKMETIPGNKFIFNSRYYGDEDACRQLRVTAPDVLTLKVGAKVMLLKNLETTMGFVNGAVGIVDRFKNGQPHVTFDIPNSTPRGRYIGYSKWSLEVGRKEIAVFQQIPLRLSWAATIHKCQGSQISSGVQISFQKMFDFGQAYVALSRATSLDLVYLADFNPNFIRSHKKVREFYEKLDTTS